MRCTGQVYKNVLLSLCQGSCSCPQVVKSEKNPTTQDTLEAFVEPDSDIPDWSLRAGLTDFLSAKYWMNHLHTGTEMF